MPVTNYPWEPDSASLPFPASLPWNCSCCSISWKINTPPPPPQPSWLRARCWEPAGKGGRSNIAMDGSAGVFGAAFRCLQPRAGLRAAFQSQPKTAGIIPSSLPVGTQQDLPFCCCSHPPRAAGSSGGCRGRQGLLAPLCPSPFPREA